MENSLSHVSSARKKLLEYQQTIKRQQSQSSYLGRTLSKQHSKVMQTILREGLQKQQSDRAFKRQYSTKGYHSTLSNGSKTPSSGKKFLDLQLNSLDTTKFKPLKTSRSSKYDQIRIQNNNQQNSSQADNNDTYKNNMPQFYNDTDQMRSARQNQLMEAKRIRFSFSFLSYLVQIIIAYGIFIGILYLIKMGNFPYFQILLILALTLTINPWKISNLILPLTAIPITIVNNYIGLSSLTYVQILICYFGTMTFNQKYKIKILFILVIIFQVLFGFFILPAIYRIMGDKTQIYNFMFPAILFLLRNIIQLFYWIIGYSQGLFLQIPLFIIGLQYGTIMTIAVGQIQFWYLIVFFTLQIMNDRTHFFLNVMVNLVKFCYPQMKTTPTPDSAKKNNHILPAHWNGFSSINSFHLLGCIYIFTSLPLSSSPYSSSFQLSIYITNNQWYKPIIIWILVSVYQIMCLMLQRKKENVMLIGYTKNKWYHVICRSIMLVLGLWMFYIGLAIGGYIQLRVL